MHNQQVHKVQTEGSECYIFFQVFEPITVSLLLLAGTRSPEGSEHHPLPPFSHFSLFPPWTLCVPAAKLALTVCFRPPLWEPKNTIIYGSVVSCSMVQLTGWVGEGRRCLLVIGKLSYLPSTDRQAVGFETGPRSPVYYVVKTVASAWFSITVRTQLGWRRRARHAPNGGVYSHQVLSSSS